MRTLGLLFVVGACRAPEVPDSVVLPPKKAPEVEVTDPDADCVATVTGVEVRDLPNPLAKRLDVALDGEAGVFVVCRPDDDPEEALLVESGTSAGTHGIDVRGLYGESGWTCTVTPACRDAGPSTVALDPVTPPQAPRFTVTGTPTGAWTLLNTQQGAFTNGRRDVMITDPEGRIRWHTQLVALYRADIDTAWTGESVHIGGGWGLFETDIPTRGLIRQLDLSGREIYARDEPLFGEGYNHHCEPLADGEILSLTGTFHELEGEVWNGIAVERLDPVTETVTWSWDSQALVDAGLEGPYRGNPWNGNALAWTTDGAGEALWISLYTGQAMWRIDPVTLERTHIFGHDGDFALVDVSGEPLDPADEVYGQHGPDFSADGRVLLYDNGVGRPGGNQSRVVEFRLDFDTGEATLLWEWTEEGWYTPIIGDADWLASGNVLVTKGVVPALTPFNVQPSAIIEVDPTTDAVVWRMEADGSPTPAIYRSQRYAGCAIFRSARHCSEVADRIFELTTP